MKKFTPSVGNGSSGSGEKIRARDVLYVIFANWPKGTGAISGKTPEHCSHGQRKGEVKKRLIKFWCDYYILIVGQCALAGVVIWKLWAK
jgi:hypothetical protein